MILRNMAYKQKRKYIRTSTCGAFQLQLCTKCLEIKYAVKCFEKDNANNSRYYITRFYKVYVQYCYDRQFAAETMTPCHILLLGMYKESCQGGTATGERRAVRQSRG